MQIIAHRGASSLEPENTVRSFITAQDYKVNMIELDVRESREGELVVFHDHRMSRLFGVHQNVSHFTVEELKKISRDAGREIPTLAEALAAIQIPVNFDVKVHGIEKKLMNHIKKFSPGALVSSTYPGVLKKIRALDENIRLGLLIGKGELHLLPIIHYLTWKLKLHSIHPKNVLANPISIPILRTLGKEIYVWTVNEPHEYQRIKQLGVDGIFTDCPQLYADKA